MLPQRTNMFVAINIFLGTSCGYYQGRCTQRPTQFLPESWTLWVVFRGLLMDTLIIQVTKCKAFLM